MMRHSHSTPTIRRLAAALCVVVTMPAAGCFTSVELSFAASDPEVAPKPGEDLHLPGPAELPLLRRRTRRAALPIVLMHGMAGFDKVGGVTYFLGVAPAIAEAGYQVFATEVEPFNSVYVRATQAGARIQEIPDETGAAKVHIIAHSQSGLDARAFVVWAHSLLGDFDEARKLADALHREAPDQLGAIGLRDIIDRRWPTD